MIEEFVMSRWMIVWLLCLMLAVPLYAQDDAPTPYEIALQRIEAARVSNATDLDLSRLSLTELPPEIGQLGNLQRLNLIGNRLTTIPAEIGQLSHLQCLWLEYNELTTLPAEIGQLSNLQCLQLSNNQVTTLLADIGQLKNLLLLSLSNNQLTNLPIEIGQLSQLEVLELNNNQLTSLPPEIGQLHSLCALYIRGNNIQHLPTTISNLGSLVTAEFCNNWDIGIFLEGNPLISPPPEVVEQGTAAVLAYLRNQAWYHMQRLIIGAAGGVGLFVLLVLGFRWKQHGGHKLKPKRG
jgi:Leucine-rich repeat (LRR) protein